jgi:hypothetical protein
MARFTAKQSAPETDSVKATSAQTHSKSSQEELNGSNHRAISRKIGTIFETPENWTIYRKPDLTDPTFVELCDSIRKSGINTPLEISRDSYIISGHRRFMAAKKCGLSEIPCFVDGSVVMENGAVASLVGWQYVGFGLFIYLSGGSPPSENRVWLWRLGRWLLRWGSLSVALCCFLAANNRVSGSSFIHW